VVKNAGEGEKNEHASVGTGADFNSFWIGAKRQVIESERRLKREEEKEREGRNRTQKASEQETGKGCAGGGSR